MCTLCGYNPLPLPGTGWHTRCSSFGKFSSKFQSWFNIISTHLPLFLINLPLIVEVPYESSLDRRAPRHNSSLIIAARCKKRINACERPELFFFFFPRGLALLEKGNGGMQVMSAMEQLEFQEYSVRLWRHSWGCYASACVFILPYHQPRTDNPASPNPIFFQSFISA